MHKLRESQFFSKFLKFDVDFKNEVKNSEKRDFFISLDFNWLP